MVLLILFGCSDGNTENKATPDNGADYSCPTDGGDMRRLPEGFCIDKTEVTRSNYFAWLEKNPAVDNQTNSCAGNIFTPSCGTEGAWGLDRFLEKPIGCVDWCDAIAYCTAHGKRLCGHMDGGMVPIEQFSDESASEWYAACSAAGQYDFVYGNTYDQYVCRESPKEGWVTTEVGELPYCQSTEEAYAGVYDLAGNVAEWENSCESDAPDAGCRVRGGGYVHSGSGIRCDAGDTLLWPRNNSRASEVGIRCCAD